MMGPVTTSELSASSTGEVVLAAATGGAAAPGTAEAAGSVPPQPAASATAPTANNAIRLRMHFLHRQIKERPLLPTQPIPGFRIEPQTGLPEKNIRRGIPSRANFSAALHAGANGAVRVGNRNARVKNRSVLNQLGLGADNLDISVKSSRGIAVQFHHRVLTDFQQAGFTVIHGQIDSGLRGVHDFGEGFAGLEFPSSEIFHMRRGYDTVHRRTQ